MPPRAWLKRVGVAGTVGLCMAGALAMAPMGATAAGRAPLPIGSTVLRFGDVGPAVRVLQGDLWQFGFNPGPVDGIFGPQTRAALRGFQTSSHIAASGTLDAATFHTVLEDFGYAPTTSSTGGGGQGQQNAAGSGAQTGTVSTGGHGSQSSTGSGKGSQSGSSNGGGGQASQTGSGSTGLQGTPSSSGTPSSGGTPSSSSTPPPGSTHPEILAYWAVWGSNTTALSDLQQHASAITWLSPYWYTLRGNGTLASRESDHAQVTSAAHAVGVPVLALVNQGSGVTALLSTTSGRQTAVNAIAGMLQGNPGVTGVVIDFEALPASSRSNLTAFVQQLRSTLPRTETVGVAVMPKSSSPGPSYAQVFDYAALGQAADFIQLMTYDRHSDGSAPGAISPNNWVAQVAQYAATVIPAKKILIGVPGYGYDWSSGTSATSIDATQAISIAAAHGVTPTYDPTSGENHFTYTSGGQTHTVWFESAQGVAAKYNIVQQLGLGGMALWTIGGEQPAFWPAAEGQG